MLNILWRTGPEQGLKEYIELGQSIQLLGKKIVKSPGQLQGNRGRKSLIIDFLFEGNNNQPHQVFLLSPHFMASNFDGFDQESIQGGRVSEIDPVGPIEMGHIEHSLLWTHIQPPILL